MSNFVQLFSTLITVLTSNYSESKHPFPETGIIASQFVVSEQLQAVVVHRKWAVVLTDTFTLLYSFTVELADVSTIASNEYLFHSSDSSPRQHL
jgi:hypothetical protein